MSPHDEILRMLHDLRKKSKRNEVCRHEAERTLTARYAKKETSSEKQMELVEVVGKKVKEAVKETITGLKEKDPSSGS